mgnify:CR=1 FL=1
MKKKEADKSSEDALLLSIIDGIEEVKGHDIKILDLRNIEAAIADYFIVCTGTSTTQVEAIARSAENFTRKELDERPRRVEGVRNAQWVLMDYFTIIVHVFYEPMREHYDIEGLWADGKVMALPKKAKPEPKAKAEPKPKAEPNTRAARIKRNHIGSRPTAPAPSGRSAASRAARVPSSATDFASNPESLSCAIKRKIEAGTAAQKKYCANCAELWDCT